MWALWGKLGQWLPKAGVGGLTGPFWVTQILEQNVWGRQQPWAVTNILHLLILPVFVIQEGFKIRGTYKFVLYVSQDCHLPCPTVSKAHGHQLLPINKEGDEIQNHKAHHTVLIIPRTRLPYLALICQHSSTSSRASALPVWALTCRKEQAVPIVTSRVTLPRRSCTFPDLRMSSLPT